MARSKQIFLLGDPDDDAHVAYGLGDERSYCFAHLNFKARIPLDEFVCALNT